MCDPEQVTLWICFLIYRMAVVRSHTDTKSVSQTRHSYSLSFQLLLHIYPKPRGYYPRFQTKRTKLGMYKNAFFWRGVHKDHQTVRKKQESLTKPNFSTSTSWAAVSTRMLPKAASGQPVQTTLPPDQPLHSLLHLHCLHLVHTFHLFSAAVWSNSSLALLYSTLCATQIL